MDRLVCHTDLITCCRMSDNNKMRSLGGEWYYPNWTTIVAASNAGSNEEFVRYRNEPQSVSLGRKKRIIGPSGSYCCAIPTTGGNRTFCTRIGMKKLQ